ncbi:MAG: hypothetical protein WDO18_10290 [Acidobacteriota bacterium]
MKKVFLLMTAGAILAVAQPTPARIPEPLAASEVVRVVDVKLANAYNIFSSLSAIFPGINRVENQLIVRGQPAVVDMIEAAIKKLDVAPPPPPESRKVPNIELTVQLVRASPQDGPDAKIPADLEPTVRQLRALFPYKSYKVLDTEVLLGRSGIRNLEASGTLPGGSTIFQFKAWPTVVPGPAPRMVHLTNLELGFRDPVVINGTTQYSSSGIHTEIDAKEGQKTVVGKSNVSGSEDAIFLVITPRIIE